MPILAPPKPSMQVVPTEVCKSSTTIQIRFRKNYFSEQNGPVIYIVLRLKELVSYFLRAHLRVLLQPICAHQNNILKFDGRR